MRNEIFIPMVLMVGISFSLQSVNIRALVSLDSDRSFFSVKNQQIFQYF